MTDGIRSPHVQTLCVLAAEDESTLQYPLPDHIFGFHAQQSIEKLLKALISAHDRSYPLTHSLEKLLNVLRDCGEALPDLPFSLKRLDPFAVIFRYDLGARLSSAERSDMRESIALVRQHVLTRIIEVQAL